MSKNLFRKGLATGAIIALATIGLTSVPASAANEITVVPTVGTSYNTFGDQNFDLTSTLANGATLAHYEQFKYKIEVTGGTRAVNFNSCAYATASYNYENWDNNTSGYQPGSNTAFPNDYDLMTYCDQSREDFYFGDYQQGNNWYQEWHQLGWTSGWDYVDAGESVVVPGNAFDLSRNVLALAPRNYDTSADATTTVKVTTFVDADNSNTFNNNEWNTVRTINFKKYSEIKPSVTITQPKAGDTNVETKVDFGDVNTEQAYFWEEIQLDNSGFSGYDYNMNPDDNNVDGGKMVFNDSANGLSADDTVTSKLYYYSWADDNYVLLNTGTASVTPHTISNLNNNDITLVKSNDAADTNGYLHARQNKSFTAQLEVDDVQSTPAPKAGVAVVGHVYSDYSLSDSRYVTVNGKKFTDAGDLYDEKFNVTSDAKGLVSLNITTTGFAINGYDNVLWVSFSAENYTNESDWINLESTNYEIHTTDKNDPLETGVRRAVFGVSNTVHYSVKDQFGVPANGLRLAYYTQYHTGNSWNGNTGWDSTSTKYDAPVTNGAATVTFSSPAGSNDWEYGYVYLQEQGSDSNWFDSSWGNNEYIGYEMDYNTNTTASYFEDEVDDEECDTWGQVTDDATYTAGGHEATRCEYAVSEDGSLITISAPGLGIELDGKLYLDTVTFYTGYDWYDAQIDFYSYFVANETVGYRVVTATVDNAADTLKLNFGFDPGYAASLVVGTPAQAQAGQALDVPLTAYDAHGNLTDNFCDLRLLQTGAGYILNGTSQVVDANNNSQVGKYTAKLVTGSADLGTSYLNAKIGTWYAFSTDNVIKTFKTVEFGTTDADAYSAGKRVYVSYEFALGRTLTVTIDGKRKYSKVITSDNAGQLSFLQKKKGTHTVTVRVSGGLVFTEHLTTK